MKQPKNALRNFGLLSIGLCALCCALPIIGMTAGIGALTILSKYIELAGIVALVFAGISFIIVFTRKRNPPACDINCDCKEEVDLKESTHGTDALR